MKAEHISGVAQDAMGCSELDSMNDFMASTLLKRALTCASSRGKRTVKKDSRCSRRMMGQGAR